MTSQPSLSAIQTLSIGPPPCAVILSCFKKKRTTSGKLSPNVITPNGLWTRWRKDLTSLPDRSMMGVTTMPSLQPWSAKKGHIVIPYTQGLCESIRKICGRYGIQTHFKGGRTSKTFWSPQGQRPNGQPKWLPIYWYQYGDLGCDDEYIGENLQDLW